MREIRMSGSMRGGRKRAFARRACLLLYIDFAETREHSSDLRKIHPQVGVYCEFEKFRTLSSEGGPPMQR